MPEFCTNTLCSKPMKSRKNYNLCLKCENDLKDINAKKNGKFFCRGCRKELDLSVQYENQCLKCHNKLIEFRQKKEKDSVETTKCKAVIEQGCNKGKTCSNVASNNGFCLKHGNQAILVTKPPDFIRCSRFGCIEEVYKDYTRCLYHLEQARENEKKIKKCKSQPADRSQQLIIPVLTKILKPVILSNDLADKNLPIILSQADKNLPVTQTAINPVSNPNDNNIISNMNINATGICVDLDNSNRLHNSIIKEYNKFIDNAVILNKKCNITLSEFYIINKLSCCFCKSISKSTFIIDELGDLTINNVAGICNVCMTMKNTLTTRNFLKDCYFYTKNMANNLGPFINKQTDMMSHCLKIINNKYIQPDFPSIHSLHNKLLLLLSSNESSKNDSTKRFNNSDDFYIKQIWNESFDDFHKIKPEIIFVGTEPHLMDIWNWYKINISSMMHKSNSNLVGRRHFILIKDNYSQKYLGICSLSSDYYALPLRDTFVGFSDKDHKDMGLKYIYNISTCVPLPPFSYNYNAGKLLACLMHSREVSEKIYLHLSKTNSEGKLPLGFTTTSLNGRGVMYNKCKIPKNQLPNFDHNDCFKTQKNVVELNYLGNTTGSYISYGVNGNTYDLAKQYLIQCGYDISGYRKSYIMRKTISMLELPKDLVETNPKGVYFSFLYPESKKLFADTNVLASLDKLSYEEVQKQYISRLLTVDEIFEWWKQFIAIKRYNHLLSSNRISNDDSNLSIKVDLEYQEKQINLETINLNQIEEDRKAKAIIKDNLRKKNKSYINIVKQLLNENGIEFQSEKKVYNNEKQIVTDSNGKTKIKLTINKIKPQTKLPKNKEEIIQLYNLDPIKYSKLIEDIYTFAQDEEKRRIHINSLMKERRKKQSNTVEQQKKKEMIMQEKLIIKRAKAAERKRKSRMEQHLKSLSKNQSF